MSSLRGGRQPDEAIPLEWEVILEDCFVAQNAPRSDGFLRAERSNLLMSFPSPSIPSWLSFLSILCMLV
jgi:hypothetical protein